MKKTIILVSSVMLLAFAASCNREKYELNNGEFTISATIAEIGTKVSFEEDSVTRALKPSWEKDDIIIGFDAAGETYGFRVAIATENRASFAIIKTGDYAGSKTENPSDGTKMYMFYAPGAKPADISGKSLKVDISKQKQNAVPALMTAIATVSGSSLELVFSNRLAVVALKNPTIPGLEKSSVTGMSLNGKNIFTKAAFTMGEDTLTMTTSEEGSITTDCDLVTGASGETKGTVYFAVCPATGADFHFGTLPSGGNFLNREGKTLAAGHYYYVSTVDVKKATCAEVRAGEDGKVYETGGSVTSVMNREYGNFYINDGTGELYVYGTRNEKGETGGVSALDFYDIWKGDSVVVTGPKETYLGEVELKDVNVLHVTKSLVSILSGAEVLVESGMDTINIEYICRGDDIKIEPDSSWLEVLSTSTVQGRSDAYDTVIVRVAVEENTGAYRTGKVALSSSKAGRMSSDTVIVEQNSGITCYSLPYSETFGRRMTDWKSVDSIEGVGPIWKLKSGFFEAYYSGTEEAVSGLVSPKINLAGAASPILSFEHRHGKHGEPEEAMANYTLWVSVDDGTTWTKDTILTYSEGRYTSSGNISLDKYKGDTIRVKFRYANSYVYLPSKKPYWDVTNVSVRDGGTVGKY